MADQQSGTFFNQFTELAIEFTFRSGIHCTGWLVKNNDLSISQECPGQSNLLPFTKTQLLISLNPNGNFGVIRTVVSVKANA